MKESLAVVHNPDFAPLVGRLGIDHAVTPRASFANRVLKLVNAERTLSSAVLEEGKIEILEFKINGNSQVAGKPLIDAGFPKNCLVTSIMRDDEMIVPRGYDEIRSGDSVVVIVTEESRDAVQKLFKQ